MKLVKIRGRGGQSAGKSSGENRSPTYFLYDPSETVRRTPPNVLKAYLQGALADATYSKKRNTVRYSQKSVGWLEVLKEIFNVINKKCWMYKEGKSRNVYVLETSREFLDFKINPLHLKRDERISYVRGFFDADGGVICLGKNIRIQFCQKDKLKLMRIVKILEEEKIYCGKLHNPSKKIDPNYWRFFIKTVSVEKFIKYVGSWHPEKIRRMKIQSTPYSDIGVM